MRDWPLAAKSGWPRAASLRRWAVVSEGILGAGKGRAPRRGRQARVDLGRRIGAIRAPLAEKDVLMPSLDRRRLGQALTAIGVGLGPAIRVAAKERGGPEFLAPEETIRGLAVTPPTYWARSDAEQPHHYQRPPYEGRWDDQNFGFPVGRRLAALRAGFNTVRVFLDAGPFMDARTAGALNSPAELASIMLAEIGNFVAAGFKVVVNVNAEIAPRNPAFGRAAVLDGPDGPGASAYRRALADVSAHLAGAFRPCEVAIELFNEPLYNWEWGDRVPWNRQAQALWQAARASAPQHTLVVQSRDAGFYRALAEFDPRDFDANTLFCFHPYEPGGFTHQGLGPQRGLSRIAFPAERHEGGFDRALADMRDAVARMSDLEGERRAELVRHNTDELRSIFYPADPMGAGRIDRDWRVLDEWVNATGISPRQVLAGEFGVVGDINSAGVMGADLDSRAAFYRAVRECAERRGFAGWIAWQSVGDFNLFEQHSLREHGDELIPALATALFG